MPDKLVLSLLSDIKAFVKDYGTVLAAFVALAIYFLGRQAAKSERKAEADALSIAYIQPLNDIHRQTSMIRPFGTSEKTKPLDLPPLFAERSSRTWILGQLGVQLTHLHGRISAFNQLIDTTEPTWRSQEWWKIDLQNRFEEIDRLVIHLRKDLDAHQRRLRLFR